MKTHFTPYPDAEEFEEQAPCGTWLGEDSGQSGDWSLVDCKRCLGRRKAIDQAVADEEAFIVQQMGHMAEHMRGITE